MILIDTSGLLAALFADQREHIACAHELIRSDPPLILSPYVLAETDYLIQKFGGVEAELVFLEEIGRGAYKMPHFEEKDVARAREIIVKYRQLGIGLADASLVVLAERYDCRNILTLDHRHFRALRVGRQPFRILPHDRDLP